MEDQARLEQKSLEIIEQARAVFVVSNNDLLAAGEHLKGIKLYQKEVGLVLDPIVSATNKAHKEACSQRTKLLAPSKEAEVLVKGAMTKFTQEEERKRLVEEKRLQAEAKKKAEEEILTTAEEAEARGDDMATDFALSEEVDTSHIKVESKVEKVAGVVVTKIWKWRIKDKSLIPKEFWILDEKRIGQRVRADKEKSEIAGIEVFSEDNIRA